MSNAVSQRGTLAVTAIAAFMAALDNLVVTFALPSIRHDLGATVQQLVDPSVAPPVIT